MQSGAGRAPEHRKEPMMAAKPKTNASLEKGEPSRLPETLYSVAWHTDEPGAIHVRWHRATYGLDASAQRYTIDRFSEGRADHIDREDLPSVERVRASWVEYAQWVERTGEDPLEQYAVDVSLELSGQIVPREQHEVAADLVAAAKAYLSAHKHAVEPEEDHATTLRP